MHAIDLNTNSMLCRQVKQLYLEAFPKEERVPWWLLGLNARRQGIDLTAWVEGENLLGFTSSVTTDKLHFLLFFAVPKKNNPNLILLREGFGLFLFWEDNIDKIISGRIDQY